jgi:hypothetical protein
VREAATQSASVTTEGAAIADATALPDDAPLHCYRHPDRETRVLCGRCERPICTRCAMQGPVGFRCKQCGTLAYDPLTSLRPSQMLIGLAVSIALAAVTGVIASRIGFFSIILGFFAGGIIAEAVTRLIGLKHGPQITALVLGGIIVGSLIGFGLDYGLFLLQLGDLPDNIPVEELGFSFSAFLIDGFVWAAITAGAACVGAYSRLR